jgi:alpha-amylase
VTDVVFVFEVHQPHRLRRNLHWQNQLFKRTRKTDLFSYYFDHEIDREVFMRAARKCYYPSNQILLEQIDAHKRSRKQAKFAFSISGVFLEQCEKFEPDLLETFKQLAQTGKVEFLNQTYYHSVAGLYPEKDEFIEQVRMHQDLIKSLLGYTAKVFENTELLYNNAIAQTIESLGYHGIYTEGVEKVLGDKSPNYLYNAKTTEGKLRVLLRNYKLTDDIGFRFSARWWPEWPLTADKYARWLAEAVGECINIFPDYETFGEHHWPETGIHDFLHHLPDEILKWGTLRMATPTEALEAHKPHGEVDVPEAKGTVSWADVERDSTGWLGNTMQWAYYTSIRRLEPLIREAADPELLRLWRNFQTSDHLYYMFAKGGAPGEVHSYFSPYENPLNAYVSAQTSILDYEARVRTITQAANEAFLFYTGAGEENYTGIAAFSLKGFIKGIETVSKEALEFHNQRGDFANWAAYSLQDPILEQKLKLPTVMKAKGEVLRKKLVTLAQKRYDQAVTEAQAATKLF